MITKEELEHSYSNMTNNELLEILDRKQEHTEMAVLVALQELTNRNLTEEDFTDFKEEKVEKATQLQQQYVMDDLSLVPKIFFYFIWVPVFTFHFKRKLVEAGSILKLKQAHYYSLSGFIAFVLVCIIDAIYDPYLSVLYTIMVALFIPSYFFDEFYNRQKQIERIQKMVREQQEATLVITEDEL